MTKVEELAAAARGDGCLGRSADDEPVFVICARDLLSSDAVRAWADRAQDLGVPAAKVDEARAIAEMMVTWRMAHGGGPPATGSLCILNVGAGDIELRFNHDEPDEVQRAITMLRDMQMRGFAILVKQPDGSYARATAIDGAAAAYVISGSPEPVAAEPDTGLDAGVPRRGDAPAQGMGRRRRGRPRRQPIVDSHAVGVGRSAGG